MTKASTEDALAKQLRWLMFFRVVTTTFLLGTTVVVQFRGGARVSEEALTALYVLIGSLYFLTFIYAVVLPKFASKVNQATIQITGDVLITTVVIYMTGGLESAFSFMYILAIINAGILLKIRGAVFTASMSAILYGALLDLHYYFYINPYLTRFSATEHYQAMDIISTILVNMGAFYLVAFLSGYLSKQAEESRKILAAKESDLERLEDLSESIIRSIDSGLMTLGDKGEILSFNQAAERITGHRFHNVRGRTYHTVFPGLDLAEAPPRTSRHRPTWNWNYTRSSGRKVHLELGLFSLRNWSGQDTRRLLVFQDKTRIKQMEEEVKRIEKLAVIGELAAGIAHEIRNPLASISGSFQMLKEDLAEAPDQLRLVNIISRELEHLNRVVNDFLMFARPRSGPSQTVQLARVVDETLSMFRQQDGITDRIEITSTVDPQIQVRFDPHQLEQVLWNLLRNAAEAMPEGGRLTVATREDSTPGEFAVLGVSDTGQGIQAEDLSHVYDPFFTTKASGTGLGLSIVLRILEDAGGRIEIESQPGAGTTFSLHLPRA